MKGNPFENWGGDQNLPMSEWLKLDCARRLQGGSTSPKPLAGNLEGHTSEMQMVKR